MNQLAATPNSVWVSRIVPESLVLSFLAGKFQEKSLLFAWVPIVGDPLTAAAGALRMPFLPFIVLVGAGKAACYGLLLVALDERDWAIVSENRALQGLSWWQVLDTRASRIGFGERSVSKPLAAESSQPR